MLYMTFGNEILSKFDYFVNKNVTFLLITLFMTCHFCLK